MDKVAPGLTVGQLGVGIFGEGNGKCIIFLSFFFSSKDYVFNMVHLKGLVVVVKGLCFSSIRFKSRI